MQNACIMFAQHAEHGVPSLCSSGAELAGHHRDSTASHACVHRAVIVPTFGYRGTRIPEILVQ